MIRAQTNLIDGYRVGTRQIPKVRGEKGRGEKVGEMRIVVRGQGREWSGRKGEKRGVGG